MRILLFILITTSFIFNSFGQDITFERITTRDGLSQNDVLAIFQDSDGFMWFGTNDGLNRYDGYHFEVFRENKKDTNSIVSNQINLIVEDSNKNLLIGSINKGVSFYDIKKDRFTNLRNSKAKPDFFTSNYIRKATILRDGRIWLGTDRGMNFLTKTNNSNFSNVKVNGDFKSLSIDTKSDCRLFEEFSDSMAWYCTQNSLYLLKRDDSNDLGYRGVEDILEPGVYDIKRVMAYKNGFIVAHGNGVDFLTIDLQHPEKRVFKRISESNSFVVSIDKAGNLWSGGNGGLQLLKPTGDPLCPFKVDQVFTVGLKETNISNNFIRSIYVDRSGIIWIGTNGGGICKYNPSKIRFRHYLPTSVKGSISSNKIVDIYEDKDENVWFGTEGGGMNLLANDKQKQYEDGFVHFDVNKVNGQNFVYDLLDISQQNKNEFLLGVGYPKKMVTLKYSNNKWKVFAGTFPVSNSVFTLCKDNDDNIWAGCYNGGLYIYKANSTMGEAIHLTKQNCQLSSNIIRSIKQDSKGNMWVGTGNGLCIIPLSEKDKPIPNIIVYKNNPEDANSLSDNYILPIFESSKGEMWIGTLGGGLNKFIEGESIEDGIFRHFSIENGMPNNVIKDVVEDHNGDLWVSSNRGLTKFNSENNTIINYGLPDGVQDYEFGDMSGCVLHDGEVLFGGVNGFNAFYPDEITNDTIPSTTVFTQLEVNNKPVKVGEPVNGSVILESSINETSQITLGYKENNFSVHFAALHFSIPNCNHYKYRLNGYDKEWITTSSSSRFARYTNLKEGNYTLEVLTSNSDGVWAKKIKSLKIKIVPPFWQTWWFIISSTISIVAVILIYFIMRIKEVKRKNAELEKIIEIRTSEISSKNRVLEDQSEQLCVNNLELNELIKTKDKFVSIIAHDIINPFNTIIGFSDVLLETFETLTDEEKLEYIEYINISSTGLFNLLKNLLQWSRSQRGLLDYIPEEIGFDEIVETAISLYESSAKAKNIQLTNTSSNKVTVYTDLNMLNTIFRNLIGNAIKFTPDGGKVEVHSTLNEKFILVSITDSGIGISQGDIEKLFRIDIQHSTLGTNNEKGTGLGLILIQEFVKKQGGELYVESELKKGSTFSFTIPLASI